MAHIPDPATLASYRRVSANARPCGVGRIVGTYADYLMYREREINANRKPLRFELWQIREIGNAESEAFVIRQNRHHKTPMPNISPIPAKRRYRVVDIDSSDSLPGDRTSEVEIYRKPRNRINLPISTYLLSLPKTGGVPLGADNAGNIDPRLSLLILMIYRNAIATRKEVK